ncbi:formylglycine-generating enzyme family protein [bacterium]|nr:formylglycine-generating enzyme family protein [bacterium]
MKKLLLPLLIFTFSSCLFAGLVGYTSSITGDGKIEINYEVEADDEENTLPVFAVSFTAEIPGKKKPAKIKTLEGAGRTGVVVGQGTYTLVWNAKKDCKRVDAGTIVIKFEAKDVSDEAQYLCLDLKKNKMRYQSDAPNVKKSTCKTKELWLRRIEPDTFTMGSPDDELCRDSGEIQHEVTLTKAFYLSLFETTQKQFKYIAGYNVSKYKGSTRPMDSITYELLRGATLGAGWPKDRQVDEKHFYVDKKGRNVECPTFFYALREKTGGSLIFDLPTEAQWEYACRAGKATAWNNGTDITEEDEDPELSKLGRYFYSGGGKSIYDKKGVYKSTKYYGTAKAGSYLPNDWGLYDCHGNVFEWCLDWYGSYGNSPVTDPLGPDNGGLRVCRGGAWDDVAIFCRSAHRNTLFIPGLSNYSVVGFRIALVRPETAPDREEFEYELLTDSDNTLPVFKTKFYGKDGNGSEFLLTDVGHLEEDGASEIVLGAGIHKVVWIPDTDHTNLIGFTEYRVEYEDVTDKADYLVLDIADNKMRTSTTGPDLNYATCRTQEVWFKRIEPGTFTMGSPSYEKGHSGSETEHQVKLRKAYYMAVFETTQGQYKGITEKNPAKYFGETRPVEQISYDDLRGSKKGANWPADREVDKKSFFGKLMAKAGNLYDLPTEAQWEYACRAGKTTALNNGTNLSSENEDENLNKLGRYSYNTNDGKGYYEEHTDVGSYLPNDWGLYDCHGNVTEWCLDWYADNLGSDPVKEPKGPDTGNFRVIRGGSYTDAAKYCRCAARMFYNSAGGFYYNGFRFFLSSRGKMTRQNFNYTLPATNTLPVFRVKFYGETDDGTEYLLSDIGTLYGQGASGIAIDSGEHKLTWVPDEDHQYLAGELEIRYEYEDVTDEANYLVFNLDDNSLRYSKTAPDLSDDACRTKELWLRRIEPGTFFMGSPADEFGRHDNETRHQVKLTKAFYIGVFETTQWQYNDITGENPSGFKGDTRPVETIFYYMLRGSEKGSEWPASPDVDEDSFLGLLRKRSLCNFDIPTEAQWEYACRAGTTTAFNNGTDLTNDLNDDNLNKLGRYHENGGYEDWNAHAVVGSYLPNAWGLYDMHGNVDETCRDWYREDLGTAFVIDPKGPSSSDSSRRASRSGCWYDYPPSCRSAARGGWFTFPVVVNTSMHGFRLVIIPKE